MLFLADFSKVSARNQQGDSKGTEIGNEDKNGLRFILADKSDTLGVLKAVVRKDGEAYRKGIRSGDYLVSVNGVPITEYCIYLNLVTEAKEQHCVFRTPEGTIKEVDW
ncbi:MAG: hypothetical protein J6X98_10735 [Bacteroidales bacterium]|nr:hypothetical protein [Bacteroidales bacterium]